MLRRLLAKPMLSKARSRVQPSSRPVARAARTAVHSGSTAAAHMADVRISIGCLSNQRLNTLKQIIPTSMGN